jgi:hypothetical protein
MALVVRVIRSSCSDACLRWLLAAAAVGAVGAMFSIGWVLLWMGGAPWLHR